MGFLKILIYTKKHPFFILFHVKALWLFYICSQLALI